MTLNLLEKILIVVAIVLLLGLSYLYLENASLKKHYIEKRDSLYVSTQNENALKAQLKMKADSLQNYVIFIINLQTENSKLKKEYILLKQKYETEKQQWLNGGGGHVDTNIVSSKDSLTFPIVGNYKKLSYEGGTTYFPKLGKYTWRLAFIQLPTTYLSELYYDEIDKLIKQRLFVDGELISNAKTTMDEKLFLLIKNNEPKVEMQPNFWDRFIIGANLSIGNEHFKTYNSLSEYKAYMSVWAGYYFDNYRVYLYKDVGISEYGLSIDSYLSLREIGHKVFGIK